MSRLRAAGRQPRGWEQAVAEVVTAGERGDFLRAMLQLQCRIVAAQYGALWERSEQGEPRLACAWPAELAGGAGGTVGPMAILQQGARNGLERGVSQVLRLESDGSPATGPGLGDGYIFVTVLRAAGKPAGVTTVVAECHDPQVITATAAVRELAAGLFDNYAVRQEAAAKAREAERIREAMALLGAVQEGAGFGGAAISLVNELARQLGCQRVSLGWIHGRSVHLAAMSDTEHLRRQTPEAAALELAMAECLDQQQPVLYPVPPAAEPLLAEAVTFSHRQLLAARANTHALSVPLRQRDEWVGVLTLEREGQGWDAATIQRLQLAADVIAPQLADRREADRWWGGHLWRSVRRKSAYVVGPRHAGWKLGAVAVLALVAVAALGTWPYRVSAPFRLEAMDRRVVPVAWEARLREVHVQPGDRVTAGQLLAQMDDTEARLELGDAEARLTGAEIERDRARSAGKQADAAHAAATVRQLQARIDLLRHHIEGSALRSPIEGRVLTGYWQDKVGGLLERGTPMFEIAPLGRLTAVVRVSEADVNHIVAGMDAGVWPVRGELATRSEPGRTFRLHTSRIVPLARPVEGSNVFEVWCELDDSAAWLRPGMEGTARLDVGRRNIAWILSHRLLDALRLWMWW